MLFVLARLDDLVGSGVEFILDLVDDWKQVWSKKGKDEFVDFLLDGLNEIRQDRNVFDGFGD